MRIKNIQNMNGEILNYEKQIEILQNMLKKE